MSRAGPRPGHMIEHLTRRDRERTAPEAETSELGGVCKQNNGCFLFDPTSGARKVEQKVAKL